MRVAIVIDVDQDKKDEKYRKLKIENSVDEGSRW